MRGSTLLEDHILREKIMHFDHERIPERVVHARGAAAHGVCELYESMSEVTKAGFLQDVNTETPVFVRFSTVAGSRGSADLAREREGRYATRSERVDSRFWMAAMQFAAAAPGRKKVCSSRLESDSGPCARKRTFHGAHKTNPHTLWHSRRGCSSAGPVDTSDLPWCLL